MALCDVILLIISALYAITLAVLGIALGWYRPPRCTGRRPFVSVIIPARNESLQIRHCLEALAGQDFDPDGFEVIVVDDRSEDSTAAQAESFRGHLNHLTILRIVETAANMAPKKHALTVGIRASRGDIILCSDADCRADRGWIAAMVACFDEDTGMVLGYSPIEPRRGWSLLHRFAALESLALASVAASSAALAKPLTATGRNLAYRRKTFDEVGGFTRIARFISGDDDLLLQLVRGTSWKIAYNLDPNSLVATGPPPTFRSFVDQRIRHASKGRHYSPGVVALLVVVYLFNVSLITCVPVSAIAFGNPTPVMAWILKASAEFLLLGIAATRLRRWRFMSFFPVVALLHPLYITVFGLWGQFGRFDWKNDTHTKTMNPPKDRAS